MTFGELAELVTAACALGALVMSYINSRKIQDVHVSIDGRMDELLRATSAEQFAAGGKDERDFPTAERTGTKQP